MDNDLNTSQAVTVLFDILKDSASDSTKLALITELDKVLSLGLIEAAAKLRTANAAADDIPAEVAELIEQRKAARKAKDFALADSLRDKISEMGYIIEETRQGTKVTKK